jgi:hypothetical protein
VKTFQCACGNTLYFENSRCLECGRDVGYLFQGQTIITLEPVAGNLWKGLQDGNQYRKCRNYSQYEVCNWLVPVNDNNAYCESCRLNHIIPNLTEPHNINLWYRVEAAKRRLLYTLKYLGLPIVGRDLEPESGLAFQFLENEVQGDEFFNDIFEKQYVLTGHVSGMITINLLEAEHSAREEMREKMNERYRTLIGHFRHESGHYYWDRLIAKDPTRLQTFRELFGDERRNYSKALKEYYDNGPRGDWTTDCISAYASSHPWEDWAETWAHYLHMVDTLDTAVNCGLKDIGQTKGGSVYQPDSLQQILQEWEHLSRGLNSLNRSMGLPDAYPFIISPTVAEKLEFVYTVIAESRD